MNRVRFSIACLIFYVILFSACREREKGFIEPILLRESGKKMTVKTQVVEISVPEGVPEYFPILSILEDSEGAFYAGYHERVHAISFFSLSQQEYLSSLSLEQEGPKGIRTVNAIDYYSRDSIFILSDYSIYLLNATGDLLNKWDFRYGEDRFSNRYMFDGYGNSSFSYDDTDKSFLMGLYSTSISGTASPEEFYGTSLIGKYELSSSEMKVLPFTFPDEYREYYYGYLDQPVISHIGSKSYASFPALSKVFEFDRDQETERIFTMSSEYIEDETQKMDFDQTVQEDAKMRHAIMSPDYGILLPLVDRKLVRLFRSNFPNNNSDFRDANRKKPVNLSVIDLENSTFSEWQLPFSMVNHNLAFSIKSEIWVQFFVNEQGVCKFFKVTI
ncbi:DUF4221 family protein [Roseivirga sp. E12]|uniref:DUF4221 family protein n=1 Tax=Roseivirga sp. E12 TaxID=2819237 RepID=UPI001ABCC2AB|nr:DUF4221 family protein [Roseivirga sp. E12]MBO3700400.1 DUF4221 family protein [Roseivirga sp. E12]